MSLISLIHYWKLVFRSVLFLAATAFYILFRPTDTRIIFDGQLEVTLILAVIWVLFVVEMILRFFPSKLESMGCQKQFSKNYVPLQKDAHLVIAGRSRERLLPVILFWVALNGCVGALYFMGAIDEYLLLVISLAYAVCDMICILFFCPFQTWIMKNKCCGSCRIYNWDYAMMFTPLLFVPRFYTWSLFGMGLLLLITWEILYHRHPERFSVQLNASLSCANCPEKLCQHKKQLHRFWLREKERLLNLVNRNASDE